jgi:hypothetical protein
MSVAVCAVAALPHLDPLLDGVRHWLAAENIPHHNLPEVRALFAVEEVTFENTRHSAIAEAFGWPSWVVGVSYDTIESGDTPDAFPRDQLVHITPA